MSRSNYTLGIDLGGTSVKCAALATATRDVLLTRTTDTADGEQVAGGPAFLVAIKQLVADIELELGPAVGIGVSAPGLAARDESCIEYMVGRLDGLMGLNWRDALGRADVVPVLNDAQAALLGEVEMGAAEGLENVFMLTLGTGVGGAAMVDGHLLRGHIGRAGHLEHITVDFEGAPDIVQTPGSREDAVGNATIAQRSNGAYETTLALIEGVEQQDAQAEAIWHRSVKALAAGIASLVTYWIPKR